MNFLMLLFSAISFATASESWLCTEESSQTQGQQIFACGVGHGEDEDQARAKAFDSAKAEFRRLCDVSTACKGLAVKVEPKRTTCEEGSQGWKCYRLLVFEVVREQDTPEQPKRFMTNEEFGRYWRKNALSY